MFNPDVKISNDPEETINIARQLSLSINKPCLIGLEGELGAGKTYFAKGFADGLNISELVTSPTFLGISESYSGRFPFVHMDFYKKVVSEELVNHYLNSGAIVLIEWINNFKLVFNKELYTNTSVLIEYVKDKDGSFLTNQRKISIKQMT